MNEKERYKQLKALEAQIDALPEVIGTGKILELAKELKKLTPKRRKGERTNVE